MTVKTLAIRYAFDNINREEKSMTKYAPGWGKYDDENDAAEQDVTPA